MNLRSCTISQVRNKLKLKTYLKKSISGKSSLSNLTTSIANKPDEKQKNDPNQYNSKDYFQFNQYSYFDMERDMIKYRLPQVSNKSIKNKYEI